ncbi:PspC domain-containing protein [Corynebacterium sp. USCH3]|uniref:PspC domain-containing protein n=1 Tax=Corynebacterium sp. USCH3 TaxID=3024840 RepID=UPI0030B74B17
MSYGTQSTTPGTGNPRGTFESTVRRMWDTRPVRFPRSQSTRSWFFGVCEGIAVRYQVSPLLVRLVFVLTAFLGGVGVWVYGIALLVMRRYTVPKTPLDVLVRGERDPRYSEDRSLAIGTLIVGAVFLVFGGIFSGGITLTGLVVSAALTGVAWWLLYERQPVAPAGLLDRDDVPAQAATSGPSGPTASAMQVDLDDVAAAPGFEPPRTQPPSWDPLGTAPFAWDLPDPGEPAPADAGHTAGEPRKKRRGLRALVVAAVLAVVLALVAGVIALGAVFFPSWGGITSVDGSSTSGTFTGGTESVRTLDDYRDYTYTMSSPTLDFTGVAVNQDSEIDLSTTMGSVGMIFPETTDGPSYRVRLNCESLTMSDVDCDSFDDTLVQGRGDTEHTLTVNVTATMSEVRFDQVR